MEDTLYYVGDHIYVETDYTKPYDIKKIVEMQSAPMGQVLIKVLTYERSHPVPPLGNGPTSNEISRELTLLTNSESWIAAGLIRGKCVVVHLNNFDCPEEITAHDDWFYFVFAFTDGEMKEYKGEIHIGSFNQAVLPAKPSFDGISPEECETQLWKADSPATLMENFLTVARGLGTFARALDCVCSVQQPSLHSSVSSACRDVTTQHAHDVLHGADYDLGKAIEDLLPNGRPVLRVDELERWSASELSLFEQGLEKSSKNFSMIKECFLPWKTHASLVEMYYLWKTTNRHSPTKATKSIQRQNRISVVTMAHLDPVEGDVSVQVACQACGVTGTTYQLDQSNLTSYCLKCWLHWRKYGTVSRDNSQHTHTIPIRRAFCLEVTPVGRLARYVASGASLLSYSTLKLKPYCRIDLLAARKLCEEYLSCVPGWSCGKRREYVASRSLNGTVAMLMGMYSPSTHNVCNRMDWYNSEGLTTDSVIQ